MKARYLWGFLLAIILVSFVTGCRTISRSEKTPDAKKLQKTPPRLSAHPQTINPGLSGENHPYGKPIRRGSLPWERQNRFIQRIKSGEMKVRMAAFQTTLPDPLPGEEANVALAADILAGIVIQPGQVFSMNRIIGPYSKARGFRDGPAYIGSRVIKTTGGGVCKIATTLYNVAVLADMKIIERHPHGMPVPYVPAGQDATVAEGSKDFRFANISPGPLLIWADTRGNTLTMAIYGRAKPPAVTWVHEIVKQWPFKTVYRRNQNIKPGTAKVIVPGAAGLIVRSKLMVRYRNRGTIMRDLGTDVYQPLPRVIEKG